MINDEDKPAELDSYDQDHYDQDHNDDIEFNELDNRKIFKQKVKIASIGLAAFVLLIFILFFLFGSSSYDKNKNDSENSLIKIDAGAKGADLEKMWRHQLEENVVAKNKEVNEKIVEIKEALTKAQNEAENKKNAEINYLKQKIDFLMAEIEENKHASNDMKLEQSSFEQKIPTISRYNLNLTTSPQTKTVDNYIAAGSFAKAIILSGVRASTAVKALDDPKNLIIRIIDPGTLPRKFKSDLKDCHLVAAAIGDLPSESAEIRLEKLSCVEIATGEIIETEVAGYISGEDGQNGLRGRVVSTNEKYLRNAQVLGTLSGLAKIPLPDKNSYNPLSIAFGQTKPMSMKQKAGNNLLEGASSSLEKVADYNIKMAESMAPVIETGTGRTVDVVFTQGVFIGDTNLKQTLAKKRNERIKKQADIESDLLINNVN